MKTWFVALIIFALATVPYYVTSFDTYNKNIDGCERANINRTQFVGLLQDLQHANAQRIQANKAEGNEKEAEANQKALDRYSLRERAILDSIKGQPKDSKTNLACDKIYSKPWPFSVL